MSDVVVECAEIRRQFVAGRPPAGVAVEAHLKLCPHCRELFVDEAALGKALAVAVTPTPEAGDLFGMVEKDLGQETGLRATLRAWPLRTRLSALWVAALLPPVFHVLVHRSDASGAVRPSYSMPLLYGLAMVLLLGYRLGGRWLLRGSNAADSDVKQRVVAAALLLFPAVVLLFVPLGTDSPVVLGAFGQPSHCFGYGAALTAPVVALYWSFERRERVPFSALVAAGALAGLAANVLLHVHCPSAHLGHLLLGHATIGVAWAVAISALAKPFRFSR